MLSHHVLFTMSYCQCGNKEGVYSRHYILLFLIFMAVNLADY